MADLRSRLHRLELAADGRQPDRRDAADNERIRRAIEADPQARRAAAAFVSYVNNAESPRMERLRSLRNAAAAAGRSIDTRKELRLILLDPEARRLASDLGQHLPEIPRDDRSDEL